MKTLLVGVCLQLCLTNGLWHNHSRDNRLRRQKGSSYGVDNERRFKKKSEYVCSSEAYSQRTRRRYNCDEKIKTNKKSPAKSAEHLGKTSQPCYDDNKYCASWASLSECRKNPTWMLTHCPIACGLCTICEDFNPYCQEWAKRGECSANWKYMKVYCKKSCSVCGGGLTKPPRPPAPPQTTPSTSRPGGLCRDKNYKCRGWARSGYCSSSRHYKYMTNYCSRSCNKCNKKSTYP